MASYTLAICCLAGYGLVFAPTSATQTLVNLSRQLDMLFTDVTSRSFSPPVKLVGAAVLFFLLGAIYLELRKRTAADPKKADKFSVAWDLLFTYNAFVNYAMNALCFVKAATLFTWLSFLPRGASLKVLALNPIAPCQYVLDLVATVLMVEEKFTIVDQLEKVSIAKSLLQALSLDSVSVGLNDVPTSTSASSGGTSSTVAAMTPLEAALPLAGFCALWIVIKLVSVVVMDLLYMMMPFVLMGVSKSGGSSFYLRLLDDEQMTREYYEMMKVMIDDPHSAGVDLGFNFYDGDYSRTPEVAQVKKFEYAWKKMGLKEGMRVIDIGCGFGDWLHWLATEKGCKCWGLNLTHGQADVVESRGIPCLRGPWQKFHKMARDESDPAFVEDFQGKFDAVTAWDTIEHYVKGADTWNKPVIYRTYRDLFQLVHFFLDPKTKCGSFWASTLHRARASNRTFPTCVHEWINVWLLTTTYSGCYPGKLAWSTLSGRAMPQMKLAYEEDLIEDYRMTSLLCKNHFGNFELARSWDLRFYYTMFVLSLMKAHFPFHFWNHTMRKENSWMWHVGGVDPKPAKTTPCHLFWQNYKLEKNVASFVDGPLPEYLEKS